MYAQLPFAEISALTSYPNTFGGRCLRMSWI